MCGIFGVIDLQPIDPERAVTALATLHHRGPDQWGEWHTESVFLGHRRLSIMDLSEQGRQPMISADAVIAVNGEIYNHAELRAELASRFHFRSASDSEVVLHGYRAWGIEALVSRLDGMFAIAIFDRIDDTLYLVRDHFGKKPLFYARSRNRLVFASEVKALFAFDDSLRVFSYEGIKNWVQYRGSNRSSTIFHDIQRLSPGCYLRWHEGSVEHTRYYDIIDHATDGGVTPGDVGQEVARHLERAVMKRLMSDVPVGLQLSGGVDSSLIAYLLHRNHVGRLHSFSIGFSEPEHSRYSEERFARHVAGEMELEHHQINITTADVSDAVEHVVWLFDGMLDYPSAIANYILDRYAKQYVTVMLVGEGADELFCGYRKYLQVQKLERQSPVWGVLVPETAVEIVSRLGRSTAARRLYLKQRYAGRPDLLLNDLNSYVAADTFERLFGKSETNVLDGIRQRPIESMPFYRRLQLVDHKTYLYSLLDRQDRASMGASVEARCPYVDKDLVEFAVTIPRDQLVDARETKLVLKRMCAGIFGEEFTYRPKKGFPMPLTSWLGSENGLKPYVRKVFDADNLLHERMDLAAAEAYLGSSAFSHKLLNYGDPDRMWVMWFLIVLRMAQDIFRIGAIK